MQCLQDEEICVVSAIEAVLKTNKVIDKFNTTAFDDLPTVKKVIAGIQHIDGVARYQGAQLADHDTGMAYLKSHKDQYTAFAVRKMCESQRHLVRDLLQGVEISN